MLCTAFLERFSEAYKKKISGFSSAAFKAIESHGWPGNVREMENRIKRAVVLTESNKLTPEDLDLATKHNGLTGLNLRAAREAVEKELVQSALAKHKGNITKVAGELGISRPTLYELMAKLGMK